MVLSYLPPRGAIISSTPAVFDEVKKKLMIELIEAMATRYKPSTKSLDLSRFYACPCRYNIILYYFNNSYKRNKENMFIFVIVPIYYLPTTNCLHHRA